MVSGMSPQQATSAWRLDLSNLQNPLARIGMKVCWKYTPAMGESGPSPRHVAEANGGDWSGVIRVVEFVV